MMDKDILGRVYVLMASIVLAANCLEYGLDGSWMWFVGAFGCVFTGLFMAKDGVR